MWVFLVLSAAFVGLCHWFLTSPYGYWKKRKVPCPKPTILVGNLGPSITMKQNLGQVYKDVYDAYQDLLYVGYYKFRKPGIILRDMGLVRDVLVTEFSSFHDNDIHVDESVDPLFSNNPFCLTGDKWKVIRGLVVGGITHIKVKNMFNLINSVGDNLIKYLHKTADATGPDGLEAKELAAKFTTDVVATCAFGLDAKSFEDPDAEFRKMGRKFMNQSLWMGIKHMILLIMPGLAKILKIQLIPQEVEEWFGKIIFETIQYRETNNIVRHDYLDMLISLKSKTTKYAFTDKDVLAQAMTFYGDGFETSSAAISFALYEIAAHPDIQQKLYEEIKETLPKYNNDVTYDAVLEMTYLDKILTETLRLHAPVPFMVRQCTKPFELPPPRKDGKGEKVVVEIGTPMVIPVQAIHFEPNIYPDPEKFDPERFTEENKEARPKCSYLGFGEGPRICLGSRFGLAQTKAAIVRIMLEFEMKVNKKTIEPLEQDPIFFMACAKGGLWLNFIKRTNKHHKDIL